MIKITIDQANPPLFIANLVAEDLEAYLMSTSQLGI
jgi:hypothetical protein